MVRNPELKLQGAQNIFNTYISSDLKKAGLAFPSGHWEKRLDSIEKALVGALGGFVFWPNAIPIILLSTLLAIGLLRGHWTEINWRLSLIMLSPFFLQLGSWLIHGMAADGIRELKVWPIYLLVLLVFQVTVHRKFFKQSFIWFSILQAVLVSALLVMNLPDSISSYTAYVLNEVNAHFNVHTTFLSAAWLLAAFSLFTSSKQPIVGRVIGSLFLSFLAVLLGGKMPFIAILLVAIVYGIIELREVRKKVYFGAGMVALVMAIFIINPVASERFAELRSARVEGSDSSFSTVELRLGILDCGIQSIKENWLLGVGPGNTRSVLEACYASKSQDVYFETEHNIHNQWLHFWISGGIFSFLLILLYMGWWLRQAWHSEDHTLFYFCLFFLLIGLTEVYWTRQFGMLFWALFSTTLYFEHGTSDYTPKNPGAEKPQSD